MLNKIKGFLLLTRWFNTLVAGLCVFWFHYFIIHVNMKLLKLNPTLSLLQAGLLAVSVMCIMAAGNAINDYFDFEQDKKFKQKRLVIGRYLNLDEAMYMVFALNSVGIGLAFFLAWKVNNLKLANVFLIAAILLWQYSATLKKLPLIGNLVVAGLCGFVFAIPVLFEVQLLQPAFSPAMKKVVMINLYGYAGFAFLATLIREIVKDAEDVEADKSTNHKTLPILLGLTPTRLLSVFLMLTLSAGIGFFMYLCWIGRAKNHFWYAALFLQFPLLVNILPLAVANSKTDFSVISVIMKVVMVFGVATLPLFHFFSKP